MLMDCNSSTIKMKKNKKTKLDVVKNITYVKLSCRESFFLENVLFKKIRKRN